MVLQRHDHRGQTVLTFGRDDVTYLTSDAGVAALAEVACYRLTDATRLADIAAIRDRFAERSTALVETTLLRRKAVAKLGDLGDVSRWLFTDDALQQATAAPVARHRADRLAGAVVHDATCSIGTELAALRSTAAVLVGSDIDEVRLAMAHHNVP
ncbi:MAG: class I SAM-dependent methyltransferase, partial [Mycolicibacterium aromaticivorans]|nr:class I SAM-dependent methyltransferase [Mycolicibacterium aromaticivorans]